LATATQTAVMRSKTTFRLADRMKIQDELIRDRRYTVVGRLTSVLFEGQRDLKGLSQARPRYANAEQAKQLAGTPMAPFSKEQLILWSSVTLDWLTNKNAPQIAISADRHDLLLPFGLTPLPKIPDPRWMPKTATEVAPRIPQLLTGCPVVGDRVRDMLKDREGKIYGVLHPIITLQVMLGGAQGGFGKISCGVDPSDATHMALVIDDSNPGSMRAYFVGGKFQFGG
jgi:hypothetical protein